MTRSFIQKVRDTVASGNPVAILRLLSSRRAYAPRIAEYILQQTENSTLALQIRELLISIHFVIVSYGEMCDWVFNIETYGRLCKGKNVYVQNYGHMSKFLLPVDSGVPVFVRLREHPRLWDLGFIIQSFGTVFDSKAFEGCLRNGHFAPSDLKRFANPRVARACASLVIDFDDAPHIVHIAVGGFTHTIYRYK